jgi:hypothetical protein
MPSQSRSSGLVIAAAFAARVGDAGCIRVDLEPVVIRSRSVVAQSEIEELPEGVVRRHGPEADTSDDA